MSPTVEIKGNVKETEFTVSRNGGPEIEYKGDAGIVAMSLADLRTYRGRSQHPDILERDIKIYEWLLAQPNTESKCSEFLERRMANGWPADRAATMKELGWDWK